jgi:hypothetical protein
VQSADFGMSERSGLLDLARTYLEGDDFDPARSDIDVLADFKPEATRGIGFRFFGYGDELAGILGRKSRFLFAT